MRRKHPPYLASVVGEPDASPLRVPERLVHDIWQRQQFQAEKLRSTTGLRIVVENPGELNTDQGPDFRSAAIRIEGVLWHGAVEIHKRSADWYRHGHAKDKLYNNVVLHVTLVADRHTGRIRREDGDLIPEIVLMPRLDATLRSIAWNNEVQSHRDFPCEEHWASVPDTVVDPFLQTLVRDRFRSKVDRIAGRLDRQPNLDQVLYEEVFRSLGYMPNAESMVVLAKRVPLHLIATFESLFDRTCILLGTAGLVPDVSEFVKADRSAVDFSLRLRDRYGEISQDLNLEPLPRQIWRFSRMRPGNFPPLRIAQAAALFSPDSPLTHSAVHFIVDAVKQERSATLLETLDLSEPDEYWRYHSSLLRRRRRPSSATIGMDRRVTIILNAFLPLAALLIDLEDGSGVPQIIRILDSLPPQTDSVTRPYSRRRGKPTSAAVSQALHAMAREWCSVGRCVECPVGRHLSRAGCRFDV